jgi:hypothetical protein
MSAQISINEAVASLQSMFPSYDEEVLRTLLAANHNHIEHTIEQVLVMEGGNDMGGAAAEPEPAPKEAPSAQFPTEDLLFGSASKPAPETAEQASVAKASSEAPASVGAPRGVKVSLPEDFLRPPGWRENNMTLGDEQLAIMLQDEMFQRQVAASMGDDFVTRMRKGGFRSSIGSPAGQTGGTNGPSNSTGNSNGNGTGSSSNSGSIGGGVPDMGIMKGLSSMSSGAKRNLNALAAKFESSRTGGGGISTANSKNPTSGTGSHTTYDDPSPRSNARTSLLGPADDDSDEEEEIVFGSVSQSHSSSNQSRSHALDDREL